ncbi:MAG TPA: MBL fold metallo-hydrolase [Spirochaetota bacterium]|nr:MBL fold metallo-hydrolase [Spirochaetota bacterium]HPJ35425.1 MBL fold metallo-hydrolase [Spirochaetota bacterium]
MHIKRSLIYSLLPLCFFLLTLQLTSAGEDKVVADFHLFKVGKIKVLALRDASNEMKAELIVNGDPDVVKKYMPDGKLPASINAFIIKTESKTILVDAGLGEDGKRKGVLLKSMKRAGIKPEDIDMVLLTHTHFDHIGGLVHNGKAVFTNAKVFLSENENKSLSPVAKKILKVYERKISTIKEEQYVFKGIKAVELAGHTPGHTGFLVESEGKELLIFGDLIHITSLQFPHPEFSLKYDSDVRRAVKIRKEILEMAAKEKLTVAGAHIIFPGIGRVEKQDKGYRFIPDK